MSRSGREGGEERRRKNVCGHGKSAGYIRNKQMHEYLPKQSKRGVVAFWDGKSKGTTHSFDLAKEYGNPLKIVKEREIK